MNLMFYLRDIGAPAVMQDNAILLFKFACRKITALERFNDLTPTEQMAFVLWCNDCSINPNIPQYIGYPDSPNEK